MTAQHRRSQYYRANKIRQWSILSDPSLCLYLSGQCNDSDASDQAGKVVADLGGRCSAWPCFAYKSTLHSVGQIYIAASATSKLCITCTCALISTCCGAQIRSHRTLLSMGADNTEVDIHNIQFSGLCHYCQTGWYLREFLSMEKVNLEEIFLCIFLAREKNR